ncbi:hypothetical protein IEQ34_005417 [Dendrobium chrysotoxum]|uniref:Uncharacterized protein n=1 Tax=Dendrobium chrysotoxum TaxID=161865 RepID=A0AAV7GUY7_DENCH|nr:hypothetical protein IEQ34_005417 [Dendrobium chrysotoxum]
MDIFFSRGGGNKEAAALTSCCEVQDKRPVSFLSLSTFVKHYGHFGQTEQPYYCRSHVDQENNRI